jgi:hypothetical protein
LQRIAAFEWSKRKEEAALLVAKDEQSDEQIATSLRISERTLDYWKRRPEFRARVAEHVAAWRAAFKERGVRERENRIDTINGIVNRLTGLIEARAADPLCLVAGRESGLMVTKKISFERGRDGEDVARVEEYATDGVVLKELREYLKQAAQELGQWVEKGELTGKNGGPIAMEITEMVVELPPEEESGE